MLEFSKAVPGARASSSQTLHKEYIGPLDGLRAVAILLVVIFHLDETYLTGGFVGVDLFFVISGYIISRNIVVDHQARNFNFLNFYRRRLARIVPAAAATVTASMCVGFLIYSPAVLKLFGRAGSFSMLSLANFYFWEQSGYFNADAQRNIFLHMWSLSVEEQFYLIWPLVAMAVYSRPKQAIYSFAGIALVGIGFTWTVSIHDSSAAFYLMPCRVFQFALGALVAAVHVRYHAAFVPEKRVQSSALLSIGLLAVALSAIFSNGQNYHFATCALLSAAGGAIAIFAINSPLARLTLGTAPARYIGRRAYSLYLVHWPVIVMTGMFYGSSISLPAKLAVLAGCFCLAEILFRTVEVRFRLRSEAPGDRKRTIGAAALFSSSLLVVVGFAFGVAPNATENGSYMTAATKLWAERWEMDRDGIPCTIASTDPASAFNQKDCLREDVSKGKILILGDSLGGEAYIVLSQTFDPGHLMLAGVSGCKPTFPSSDDSNGEGCREINRKRFEWIDRSDVSAIVLATNWQWWNEKLIETTFAKLASTGKPVILLGVRPVYTEAVPTLLDSTAWIYAKSDLRRYLAFSTTERATEILAVARRYGSQFYYVSMEHYLCPDACPGLWPDGSLVYLDTVHITASTALVIGRAISDAEGQNLREHVEYAG